MASNFKDPILYSDGITAYNFSHLVDNYNKLDKTAIYNRYYALYSEIARNRYKYENLPNGIEQRHLERFLFENGQILFFKDPTIGITALPCTGTNLNVYGDPTKYIAYAYGTGADNQKTIFAELSIDNAVRIVNNDLVLADKFIVAEYALKMTEIETTLRMNIIQQRNPYLYITDENTKESLKVLLNDIYYNDKYAVLADKNVALGNSPVVNCISSKVDLIANELMTYKNDVETEFLTIMGLNNVVQKQERLVVSEANANNDEIFMMSDLGFKNRKYGIDQVNKMFNLNIIVERTNNVLSKETVKDVNVNGLQDIGTDNNK